jgi:hypothetical protein
MWPKNKKTVEPESVTALNLTTDYLIPRMYSRAQSQEAIEIFPVNK